MTSNAKTDHSRCTFTVKEAADGTPWIMVEFYQPGIPALGDGFLGLSFREKVPMKDAERVARELSDTFEGMSYTSFSR
jgi:hypothetical protein